VFIQARYPRDAYPSQYVSVKVLTVNESAGVVYGPEVDLLKAISKAKPDHPGYKHCLKLYDTFIAESYHGPHVCIVTKVLGRDMVSFRQKQPNGTFPPTIAKSS
jgi:serine/threonine-protein kinase SRPK3